MRPGDRAVVVFRQRVAKLHALGPERGTHFLDLSQQKGRHSLPSSNLRLMAVRRVPHLPHVIIIRLLCAVTGPVG